eukprot:5847976-Pleurochrysis_carterae.AAC.1
MPSGRENGPEKRRRARRDDAAGDDFGVAEQGRKRHAMACEGGGKPGGCSASASACPAREANELDDGCHGKRRSSKYTSEATTMR